MDRATPRGWSIKTKSATLLAGFALVLTAVYGSFTLHLVRRETTAAADRLQQTAQLVAAEIDANLTLGKQRLATVAQLPGLVYGLQRLEEATGQQYIPPWTTLHYLFFKSPAFTGGVLLLDRAGKVLWTEPPGLPWLGVTLADDARITAMYREPGTSVSPGLPPDRLLPTPHVIAAARIEDPDGAVTGLLVGLIDLATPTMTGALQAVRTGDGRYLAVLDQTGRIIASSDPTQLLEAESVMAPPEREDLRATAALADVPWRVVTGQPRARALAPIRQLQRVLVLVGGVMLLFAVALGSLVIRGFVGGIARLTMAAEVMARGDLSQPVAVDERNRELATLGWTFERMRTELRGSQAALTRRLAEREELMRLKEEFLANVSHELRTPLNVIFGYTEMLVEDEERADRRDALARIRVQSEQLLKLVTDLMTLSGLNAGKIAIEPAPVAVPAVLDHLRVVMEQLCRSRAIATVVECASPVPGIYTDPLRLEQILTNLVTNAFKFTLAGTVALRARQAGDAGQIVFEVTDTGVGIPSQDLPHVFDEFRQVDGSMTRQHAGLGLGLALVRRLATLLGGTVTVESRVGEGSTFTVVLPVVHPGGDAPTAERAA